MNRGTMTGQRGAATAVFVVLLLALIGFIAVIALRMTTTDSVDTARQSDSIEALFLAESGLERATALYLGGSACGSLAPDGPHNLGRGSFTVLATFSTDLDGVTALDPGRCRVRSRGEVGWVKRTVDAVVSLPPASGGGVIVDYQFNDADRWDDGEDVVFGGKANFTKDDKDITAEKKDPADPENGIATLTPPPGVVALEIRFDYVVTGTVEVKIQVKFEGSGTLNLTTPDLSGSGSFSGVLGSRDPNTIKEVKIMIQKIGNSEALVMDNFYLGPGAGGGGSGSGVRTWRQVFSS